MCLEGGSNMALMIMTLIWGVIASNYTNYYLDLIKVEIGNTGTIKSTLMYSLKLDKSVLFTSLEVECECDTNDNGIGAMILGVIAC